MVKKKLEPQPYVKPDQLQIRENKIFSPLRQKWVPLTPEEMVRQQYLNVLLEEYGFTHDHMAEEMEVTGRGSAQARADFIIWRTPQDKAVQKSPLIIVECKAENVAIDRAVYAQGENYARLTNAPFFVTHNHRETHYWRVLHDKMPKHVEEIEGIPHADASDKEIKELIERLKVFKEDEFADLLHQCHNVIRNREKRDPVAAFDEIAKILFIKVYVERELKAKRKRQNLFSVDYLEEQLGNNPLEDLFQKTKDHYRTDRIFEPDEKLNLKPATGIEIVRLLQKYNLSDTSEDIKGIAFERFLGKTFRGEIGQFFTPRPIVEFMVRMLDPKEGDIICDPASGSGGFLIRFFEIVRQQILADADKQYKEYKVRIEADKKLSGDQKAIMLRNKFDEIQTTLDHNRDGSRLWNLANRYIYGTDANDRMARTSKMNMIMHGDGHGGVHHHDGFLNVNGIFESRFNIILTNPPFGANVEASDKILEEQVTLPDEIEREYARIFGPPYKEALARVRAAKNKPIASLFELPKARGNGLLGRIKTELLFIERCLALLKPGGRMGIVLPEGVFNNPSLAYVREFCEDRARVLAVVSLPQETFLSSGASVKASLLFLGKFNEEEAADFAAKSNAAKEEVEAKYADEIATETARLEAAITAAKEAKGSDARKAAQRELAEYRKRLEATKTREARALLKERFDYPIFMYESEKVGITATGEPDANELYPNDNLPAGMKPEDTCLELFCQFQASPNAFVFTGSKA
ncbi:MAG: N-6 DNA methylase [Deltaproteobacteria bacterium]|nr:N-6 DNA methylase [Deltaproteobacteria bacterium]